MPSEIYTSCKFCFKHDHKVVPAVALAPQYDGGDEDQPAQWVPVCAEHKEDWYYDTADEDRLPMAVVPGTVIVLNAEGGLVQGPPEAGGIPEGVSVEIHDYDAKEVEAYDPEEHGGTEEEYYWVTRFDHEHSGGML